MIDIITWLVKVIIICQAVKRDKGLTGDRQPLKINLYNICIRLVFLKYGIEYPKKAWSRWW